MSFRLRPVGYAKWMLTQCLSSDYKILARDYLASDALECVAVVVIDDVLKYQDPVWVRQDVYLGSNLAALSLLHCFDPTHLGYLKEK